MKLLPSNFFKKDYFGLSISQNSVKGVSLTASGEIATSVSVPLDPNTIDQGNIDHAKLQAALSQLTAQGSFKTPYAAICIPEYYSFTRSYSLPKMQLQEVHEALRWQIEKIFPLPKNEIYFDWKLVSQTSKSLDIIVIAVKQDVLDNLVDVLEQARIKPLSFEPSSSAITRLVNSPSDQAVIIIEINPTGSSSSLIINNLSTLTLTNHFRQNTDPQDTKLALQATAQSIQALINHHQTKAKSPTKPPQLLLTGESASPDLAKWLNSFLNQSVSLLEIPGVQPAFHQAYAAAKTNIALSNSGQSINLLPDKLQATFEAERIQRKVKAKSQLSLAFLIIGLFISTAFLATTVIRLNRQQQILNQIEAESAQFTYDSNLVSSLNKTSRTITKLFAKKTAPITLLETLETSRPPGIQLNKFNYHAGKKTLSLWGIAQDRTTLFAYRDKLEATQLFTSISIPLSSLENPSNVEFSLSMKLK